MKIVRGDLLTCYLEGTTEYQVTKSNLRQQLQTFILKYMQSVTPKLKIKDIWEIYYLTDTDNCFLADTPHARNKRLCLQKLFSTLNTVKLQNQERVVRTVFMHENLESALYGKSEVLTNQQKIELAKQNGMRYYENPDLLYQDLTAITHWETYEESYRQIQTTEERASNLNLLFEEFTRAE